jgi:predicted TPR repeat methyltransferase
MGSSDAPSRELTLDEAVSLAILLQKTAQLAAADELHRRVLAVAPNHPRALHYAGVLAHQQGRTDDALALIERSIALVAGQADWHSNLGIVLQSAGRLDRAIESYRRAIAIDPAHANAHSNLGVLLRATGQPADAETAYRAAIRLDCNHVDAWTNLGILLDGLKRTEEAAACYCKVVTLRPKHREARKLLALAHGMLGEAEKAMGILKEWLAEEPDNAIARHMLAGFTGRDVPARASDAFVEATFDHFAASFEAKLAKLSYRAPALVVATLEDAGVKPSHRLDVLDAGCGTGLCGVLLAPFARQLVGVDLSQKMLAHAQEKNVYHRLIKMELTNYLRNSRAAFDLIVSADALVYFGDLAEVAAAAAGALRPGGLFVFTLEHAAEEGIAHRLEIHGRYSHGRAYIERLLASAGLQPKMVEAELRMEAGAPVRGLVVRAAKAEYA